MKQQEDSSLQRRALEGAINMLKGIGATYVIQYGGEVHSHGSKSKGREIKHKGIVAKVRKMIENVEPGQCITLQLQDIDAAALQRTATSVASREWGSGSYMSALKGDAVEILRIH